VLYPGGIDYTSNAYSEWLGFAEDKGLDGETIDGVFF